MTQFNTTKDVERTCKNKQCRRKFMARSADVNRGWAKFCSKSCKAREQTRRTGHAGPTDRDDDHNYDQNWDAHKEWL